MDTIRVIRIYEFVGPRDVVEEQIAKSIQGERRVDQRHNMKGSLVIRAATLGTYPEILNAQEANDYNLHTYVCADTEHQIFAGPFSFLEDAISVEPAYQQAYKGAYIYRAEGPPEAWKTLFWYNRAVSGWVPNRKG